MRELTDIYLITGFLGAGKTTFMKKLLKIFSGSRTALIVNEFGREGVDGALLEKEGMLIEEIVDGSIFCVCRSDKFIDAVIKTQSLGVDNLVIESSGLADPFGMHEVMGIVDKLAPEKFHYSGSICVVDAVNFERVYRLAPAAKQQVQGADLILLNKIDLVSVQDSNAVEKTLRELNDFASVVRTSYGRILDRELIYSLRWHRSDTEGVLVKKTLGISKFTLKFDSVPVDSLTKWLKEWAVKAYRVKGFCGGYYVQAVHDNIEVSEFRRCSEDNFLVVLTGTGEVLKTEIKSSWKRHFKSASLFEKP